MASAVDAALRCLRVVCARRWAVGGSSRPLQVRTTPFANCPQVLTRAGFDRRFDLDNDGLLSRAETAAVLAELERLAGGDVLAPALRSVDSALVAFGDIGALEGGALSVDGFAKMWDAAQAAGAE